MSDVSNAHVKVSDVSNAHVKVSDVSSNEVHVKVCNVAEIVPVPVENQAQPENELVVPPPPLSRSQTKKAEPQNMHMILSICGHALKNFGESIISASTILLVLQKVIQAAQNISKLDGDDLKQICMDAVHWLIEHVTNLSDSEKDTLDVLSEKAFSQTFDMIVAVEKIEQGCLACFCKK